VRWISRGSAASLRIARLDDIGKMLLSHDLHELEYCPSLLSPFSLCISYEDRAGRILLSHPAPFGPFPISSQDVRYFHSNSGRDISRFLQFKLHLWLSSISSV